MLARDCWNAGRVLRGAVAISAGLRASFAFWQCPAGERCSMSAEERSYEPLLGVYLGAKSSIVVKGCW